MQFTHIIGQDEVKKKLVRTIRNGRVSHAQLFLGPDGSAKLALAIAYAQYLNCENKGEEDSCGTCPSCLKYEKLAHPDLHFVYPVTTTEDVKKKPISKDFIEKGRTLLIRNDYNVSLSEWYDEIGIEKKQAIINADDCEEIIRTLQYKSYESEYKVVIIWMVEKLFHAAAPKILKVLEEPPEKTLFILVCENHEQVLATILSRTQLIKIPRVAEQDIVRFLMKKMNCAEPEARRIAGLAFGSLKEAMNNFHQSEEEKANFLHLRYWWRECWQQNAGNLLNFAADIGKASREKQKSFLQFVLQTIRLAFLYRAGLEDRLIYEGEEREFVMKLSKVLHPGNLHLLNEELNKAIFHIERNAYAPIVFTDLGFTIGRLLKIKE